MTKINCKTYKCQFNDNGVCQCEEIEFGTDGFYVWCSTCKVKR